ncbi:hypothetical protein [Corynebacterium diphtheriae]|uniref:hypothetical protein n=1 Tax=Corynebacterium diphtheriae TaxID=1717 RepID=UPI0018C93F73|nr:hypothetical protein [Corynebacterium diphtheriae]MBG9336920.1 hypothetical protein [Corynebacterium diphtheriae bv. gravis]
MAGKSAILSVRIIADATKAKAGLDSAAKSVGDFEKSTGNKLAAAKGHIDKIAGAATVAGGAYAAFAKKTLDAASEMQQSSGAVEAVFKKEADAVKHLAANAAQSVGLSASQYQQMAAVMGSQLGNLGIAQKDVIGTTDKLITLGADLASMFGGTTSEAVEALSSLLRGERDPIERYAVSINQAAIDAHLASKGLGKLEGEAKKQAETQATLELLFKQTADATGNFARETDTAAGSAQIAAAKWEDAKAKLGEGLLPVATAAADVMGDLAQSAGEHPRLFTAAGLAIAAFVGTAWTISTAIKAATGAQVLFNLALNANPIGLVVTLLTAAGTAFYLLYQKCDRFRIAVRISIQVAKNFGTAIKTAIENAMKWVDKLIGKWISFKNEHKTISNSVTAAIKAWFNPIGTMINLVKKLIGWISEIDWPQPPAFLRGGGRSVKRLYAAAPAPALLGTPAASAILTAAAVPALTAAYAPPDAGYLSHRNTTSQGTTVNITVNGAIDPDSTARQIKKLLEQYDRRQAW